MRDTTEVFARSLRAGRLFFLLLSLAVCLAPLAGCAGGSGSGAGEKASGRGEAVDEERTEEFGGMSLRDAVGQMFVVSMGGTEPDYYIEKMVRERNIGGVLLFGYNMESEAQVESLTASLQELAMETEPAVPMFFAVDYEGGEVASAPWVSPQPAAAEVGARANPEEAYAVAKSIGEDLLKAGVNTNFAPVADTGFGAAIGSRSYGEDPILVSKMIAASVEGYEDAGVVSSAKHFPNHGPATSDSHESLPVVEHDASTLESYDLPPFRAAVEAGVPMVMVGHLLYPAIDSKRPASLSPAAYRMLREDLGFEGVAVTDDLAMEGANAGDPPAKAAVQAVKAGADLLIISSPPQQQADAYNAVVAAVERGEIPRQRVREAVARVSEIKKNYLETQ